MKHVILILFVVGIVSCSQGRKEAALPPADSAQPAFSGYCGYVTAAELEEALGTVLTESPKEITEDYLGGFGCSFVGANDSKGANFGYIIFPSDQAFDNLHDYDPFSGVGDEAYLLNGADAQQLWAREGDRYVMVALGEVPRTEKSAKLARLILERLKTKPLN
jgi:hypothetical protein